MLNEKEFHERITRPLIEEITLMSSKVPSVCVPSSKLDEVDFNHALWWVNRKKDSEKYRMAVVRDDLPERVMRDMYLIGPKPKNFVFIREEYSDNKCLIEVPYSKEEIERQESRGSLIDCHVMLGVPRAYFYLVG